jgi:hypothetical protein
VALLGFGRYQLLRPIRPTAFATSSLFNNPIGIAVRSSYKEVYVANTGTTAGDTDSSILKITYDSSGNATAVTTFLSGTSTSSMLCGPVGLAINGNVLYISNGTCTDKQCLRQISYKSYAGCLKIHPQLPLHHLPIRISR